MPTEYEAKILDIDPGPMAGTILDAGGRRQTETVLQRRYVYDITPGDERRWIRLRDTGRGATLAVKEITHDGIDGTEETEIGVDRFEETHALLDRLGFTAKSYQENRRASFVLDGARLEIDEWPRIPPYLEIEGDSRDHVLRVAALIGFTETDLTGENTLKVYARYGIDLLAHSRLTFDGH